MEQNVCTIGQSVVIKGDLSAKEDLTIEGQVEGTIELDHSVLNRWTERRGEGAGVGQDRHRDG